MWTGVGVSVYEACIEGPIRDEAGVFGAGPNRLLTPQASRVRLERTTCDLEDRCSIQLSYRDDGASLVAVGGALDMDAVSVQISARERQA